MESLLSFENYIKQEQGLDGRTSIIGGVPITAETGVDPSQYVNDGTNGGTDSYVVRDWAAPDFEHGIGVDGKHHSIVGGRKVISDDGSLVGNKVAKFDENS